MLAKTLIVPAMKLFILSCIVSVVALTSAQAATQSVSDRQKKLQEIAKLDAELKPLRLRAAHEAEVIAARKEADEALRRYYEVLRLKMAQLEPKMKTKISRHVKLRKEVHGGSAGSRAEDYREAAIRQKSAETASNKP